MAGVIRATPEELRGRAGDVDRQRGDFEQLIRSMDSILAQLQSEWEGAASRKFKEQFDDLKRTSFQNMTQLLEDLGTQLRQTADAVENMDNEIASRLGVQ